MITLTDNFKIASSLVSAIKLGDNTQDIIYPLHGEPYEANIDTVDEESFYTFGSLLVNKTNIESIKTINGIHSIKSGNRYFNVEGDLPATIDEMLALSNTGGGGGSSLGYWDMTAVGAPLLLSPNSEASYNASTILVGEEFTASATLGEDASIVYADGTYTIGAY